MSKTAWIWVVVAIILIGGVFWWISQASAPAPVDQGASSSATQGSNTDQNGAASVGANVGANVGLAPMSATVTYDGSSFSPASVTIAKGGTVNFVDSAGSSMWVASGQHPTHTTYDGTSESVHCAAGYSGAAPFDQCGTGASYSFTFTKVETWGYHDHRNASAHGTVIVQ